MTLIEQEHLGGVCLNKGCIPSKALLRSADVARLAREELGDLGVRVEYQGVDWGVVQKRKDRVVSQLVKGVAFLMKSSNVRVVMGTGRLVDGRTISVDTGGAEEVVTADRIILAAGFNYGSIQANPANQRV